MQCVSFTLSGLIEWKANTSWSVPVESIVSSLCNFFTPLQLISLSLSVDVDVNVSVDVCVFSLPVYSVPCLQGMRMAHCQANTHFIHSPIVHGERVFSFFLFGGRKKKQPHPPPYALMRMPAYVVLHRWEEPRVDTKTQLCTSLYSSLFPLCLFT